MGVVFNENKVIVAGRLVTTPELKQISTGTMIATSSIAVNRQYSKDKESKPDFFEIIAWGNKGEFLNKYFQKGSPVYIVGHLQNQSWTANDGTKRTKTSIVADDIKFVETKPKNESEYSGGEYTSPSFEEINETDDLPF